VTKCSITANTTTENVPVLKKCVTEKPPIKGRKTEEIK
jgi:hypothetical protein